MASTASDLAFCVFGGFAGIPVSDFGAVDSGRDGLEGPAFNWAGDLFDRAFPQHDLDLLVRPHYGTQGDQPLVGAVENEVTG